jgi:hypothetical protein
MKVKKSERHLNLPKYYKVIQAQNKKAIKYNYTKLVSSEKAYRYVHGEMTISGRVKKLKDNYKII